ncbi:MAG TPA: hypothetical protein VJH97_06925 [Candidatus Nanoarchaeia archaeon]|nr:hypothetical protein [Candidatus Nanoarchaeia archaeon]
MKKYGVPIALFLGFFLFFGFLQFSTPGLIDYDAFYHIKYASLMRTQGIPTEFPWMQASILGDNFADLYFFYHLLLVPFAFLDLIVAAKLAAAFFASFLVTVFYLVLEKYNIRLAWLWAIFLPLVSSSFLYRLRFSRPIALSIVLLILVYFFMTRKNYPAVFITAFLLVWTHPPFYFILVLLGAEVLAEIAQKKRLDGKLVVFTIAGIIGGLIINPYFPANIAALKAQGFDMIMYLFSKTGIVASSELGHPTLWGLFKSSGLVIAVFLVSVWYLRKKNAAAFLIASFFMVLSFMFIRPIEYAVPFVMLYGALSLSTIKVPKKVGMIALMLFSIVALRNISEAYSDAQHANDVERYKECAEYLAENTPLHSVVFHADWDNFPELFYYNTHNYYLNGLTPFFMLAYDKDKYWLWYDISQGGINNPAEIIKKEFNTIYIFVDKEQNKLAEKLESDPNVYKRIDTSDCKVFIIIG